MMSFYRLILLVFLLLTPLSHAASEEATSTLQPVRVQLKWTHQFQFAGYYAAIEQGYYEQAGLDVRLFENPSGLNPVDQLIGGQVDFAVGDTGSLIYRANGVPVVALAAIFQRSPSILLSLQESGIRELADLKGRRAMLSGGYMNAELLAMLPMAGVTADDINLVQGSTSVDALLDDQTDVYNAYSTNEPWLLEQRDIPYVVFAPHDYGIEFYGDILLTTESRLNRDPDKVRRFREASLAGWRYAVEHPDEVVELIYNEYNTTDKSLEHLHFEAQETIRLILPDVVPIGYMSLERWQHIADIFAALGQIEEGGLDLTGFLYMEETETTLSNILWQHRYQISAWLALLVAILFLIHIARLRAQVRAQTRELQEAWQRAETEARTDVLTGLANRRYFVEILTPSLALAERYEQSFALISMDVDFFKKVNDQYGHNAGDKALQCAAQLLQQLIRSSDFAARIGGEEFAIAAPNTDYAEALKLSERLRSAFADLVVTYEGQEIPLTCSFGVTLYRPGESMDALFNRADAALYQAKQGGRNRVCGEDDRRSDSQ